MCSFPRPLLLRWKTNSGHSMISPRNMCIQRQQVNTLLSSCAFVAHIECREPCPRVVTGTSGRVSSQCRSRGRLRVLAPGRILSGCYCLARTSRSSRGYSSVFVAKRTSSAMGTKERYRKILPLLCRPTRDRRHPLSARWRNSRQALERLRPRQADLLTAPSHQIQPRVRKRRGRRGLGRWDLAHVPRAQGVSLQILGGAEANPEVVRGRRAAKGAGAPREGASLLMSIGSGRVQVQDAVAVAPPSRRTADLLHRLRSRDRCDAALPPTGQATQPGQLAQLDRDASVERWVPSTCGFCSIGCGLGIASKQPTQKVAAVRLEKTSVAGNDA